MVADLNLSWQGIKRKTVYTNGAKNKLASSLVLPCARQTKSFSVDLD